MNDHSRQRVAAIQMPTGLDRSQAITQAEELVREAASQGAQLAVLPELYSLPFVSADVDLEYFTWAEPLDGPSMSSMVQLSEQLGITIVTSVFEEREIPGMYGNTACTIVNGDVVQVYRKSHLPFSNGFPEKFYFRPGEEGPKAVDSTVGRIGTIICYERHFPELGREVALSGGRLLSVPVACASAPMKEVFQLELRAQAVANGFYVVCANRSGQEGDKQYFGTSAVYDPNGEVVASVDDGAGVAVADFDPNLVISTRRRRPFLRDRRPELYTRVSQPLVD